MRRLTIYSRPGCHLCEDLLIEIEPSCQRAGVKLELVDISTDARLLERFGTRIPVLCDGDHVLGEGRIDPAMVSAWLAD